MGKRFTRRPMRQRIIALVAAYAVALASLIAGFGAAEVAAAAANGGNGVICHSDDGAAGNPTGSHDSNAAICLECCVGCLTPLAAVAPPDVAAATRLPLAFTRLELPTPGVRIAGARSNAHRSRGPPPVL